MIGAEWKLVVRLVLAHARHRPGRIVLTALSTIAAACLVVWVVSGYDALRNRFGAMGEEYMGRYDVLLLAVPDDQDAPRPGAEPTIPDALLSDLRNDPAVAAVDPAFETRARIQKAGATETRPTPPAEAPRAPTSGPRIMGGMADLKAQVRAPRLVGIDAGGPPQPIVRGAWFDPKTPDRPEGAMTRDSAEALGIGPGDEVTVSSGRTKINIKVVAILEQPKRLPPPKFMVGLPPTRAASLRGGPAGNALYVPTALAARISGTKPRASYAGVVLKGGGDAGAFLSRWSGRLEGLSPPIAARTAERVGEEVDRSTTFEGVRGQSLSAMGIALLAALFIIFATLSMGVHERIRQFAMLRAVVLTRRQIGAMIVLEGALLGLIGWAGGLLAGLGLLALMARLRPEAVSEGAELGRWSVALSGLCALGGALGASILPAWRATRVSPLDAMAPPRSSGRPRISPRLTATGLVLIAANPLVVFFVPMPDTARFATWAAIGCTAMAVGFVLLAPAAILLVEARIGPALARLLGLNPRLLATQLSANLWRTAGTTIALTLGLGLFVAMQTWGYSMLGPFTPGAWTPDLIVSIAPAGVPDSEIDAVRHAPGIDPERFVPLAIKQVKFAEDLTGSKTRASATRQDSCVLVGVDPDAALGGPRPLFDFAFTEGSRDDAIARMKRGRGCLVPDHFQRETGLGLGGKFAVIDPDHPGRRVDYEIAGVVSMPGWHWMSKVGFRRGRAAGLMFSPYETVRADFDTGRPSMFWMDTDGKSSEAQIKAALLPIARRNFDPKLVRARPGDQPEMGQAPSALTGGATVTLRSAAGVREQVRERAAGIIWTLSALPLVTLAVTSLGVVNMVLASVRSRRWDFGVLRALGVTRSGLFRLIVAEALLVGVVACLLGLGFGALAGYCGTGVTRHVNIRGGQITPLVLPWPELAVGFAIALGLCLLAALGPAFTTGRTEPLKLLKEGRGSS